MGIVSVFIEAANYTAGRPGGPPIGIVIHDEEFPEKVTSAEDIAGFFHNQPKNRSSDSSVNNPIVDSGGSSAHYTHDPDSTVQCVRDEDTAWDAPPNTEWPHLGFEHDGFAKQTREEWLDDHGRKMLRRSARLAAKKSAKYGIPVRRLTVDELRAKRKGFAGHRDVAEAFRKSDHSDPGDQFPWGWYLTRVRRYRWRRYFVFRITADGKLIAKSAAAREDKAPGRQRREDRLEGKGHY
jgi:hypothetical protein